MRNTKVELLKITQEEADTTVQLLRIKINFEKKEDNKNKLNMISRRI